MSKLVYVCEYESAMYESPDERGQIMTTDVAEFISQVREVKSKWDTVQTSIKTYAGELKEISVDKVLNPIIPE